MVVTLDDALTLLDLDRSATRREVRAAYRGALKTEHPDRGGSDARTADIVAAYETVAAAFESDRLPRPDPPPSPEPLLVPHDDTLVLHVPADEVFERLHAAIDLLGTVTYADPQEGLLQGLIGPDEGPLGQLGVSLRKAGDTTEAMFTLESLGNGPAPAIESVVRAIAAVVRA